MDAKLAIDCAVLLLYFVLIISIGLYMGRKQEDLKDFALGGRSIPWWAVLASIARLYVAAIALALAYEMISGTRPNQTETLWIYIGSTIAIVILTAIYTTLGGIKAVIWTDFIQASIMIGSALVALGLLYSAIPGGWNEIVARHGGFGISDFLTTGLDPAKTGWEKIKGMFETEYTIFAGLIGATFITMATHG